MSVSLNPHAVTYAKRLIQDGALTNDQGDWGRHNPEPAEENAYLEAHEIEEYGNWHLGLDMSKGADTKGRYKFPYGDFKTVPTASLPPSSGLPSRATLTLKTPPISCCSCWMRIAKRDPALRKAPAAGAAGASGTWLGLKPGS